MPATSKMPATCRHTNGLAYLIGVIRQQRECAKRDTRKRDARGPISSHASKRDASDASSLLKNGDRHLA
jgi:hypothetical protein